MPLNIFKQPQEKADEEFKQAYEKGVHLGPEKYSEAARHFAEASKHYATVGSVQKSAEAYALATLFYTRPDKCRVIFQYALVTQRATDSVSRQLCFFKRFR